MEGRTDRWIDWLLAVFLCLCYNLKIDPKICIYKGSKILIQLNHIPSSPPSSGKCTSMNLNNAAVSYVIMNTAYSSGVLFHGDDVLMVVVVAATEMCWNVV